MMMMTMMMMMMMMMMILCGDGFMDFFHRPKSKILKIKKLKSQRFGSWLCFRPQVNGRGRRERHLLSWAP
jgi:hypothetical protein